MCGVCTISVPWADARVHYITQFEACVIDWLYDSQTISVISECLGVSWSMIDNIMSRGVTRGKARKKQTEVKHICVDETASKKGHNYVTVVSDPLTGTVLYVGSGRKIGSLEGYYDSCSTEQLEALESVSMNMWPAYITATKEHVPEAEKKIAFDRFHVAKYVNEGVDQVRREENRVLKKDGILNLVGTKYDWLKNRINMSAKQKARFDALKNSSLKTARAWAMKDLFQRLYKYKNRT